LTPSNPVKRRKPPEIKGSRALSSSLDSKYDSKYLIAALNRTAVMIVTAVNYNRFVKKSNSLCLSSADSSPIGFLPSITDAGKPMSVPMST
jgi:hypothetical protein